jgi:hypothetical protein
MSTLEFECPPAIDDRKLQIWTILLQKLNTNNTGPCYPGNVQALATSNYEPQK